jgi:energy-coupling factor transporter ATP-binding protein EcfA2
VVHIHGVSGIGKSTLIRAFAEVEPDRRRTVRFLDGREFEPTERGFLHELSRSMRVERPTLPKISRTLSAIAQPVLIILDSYELLGLLDAWLRQRSAATPRAKRTTRGSCGDSTRARG